MNTFFLDEIKDDTYKIALIDRHRIFEATEPGLLGTVFECSLSNPTREDDAQIFYALASTIGANDVLADLETSHRSQKLNSWSIAVKDPEINNLFMALEPLTRSHRLEMYGTKHSISPDKEVTSDSMSLFSLVAFSEQQKWKTGVLQQCIDRLVNIEHRGNPQVYSVIDEQYRRIIRFKLETEVNNLENNDVRARVLFVQRLMKELGLSNSHDDTIFTTISPEAAKILKGLCAMIPMYTPKGTIKEQLSDILTLWSGSTVSEVDGGYQLQVDATVAEGLTYMQPWLPQPKSLTILDAPM
jgi:hypothetical protein